MLSNRVAAGLLVVIAIFVIAILVWPINPTLLIPPDKAWTQKGSFRVDGAYSPTFFNQAISVSERQRLTFWGSWSGSDSNTGELRSPVFRASPILEFFFSGYPNTPGVEIYLERESDHLRFPMRLPGGLQAGQLWQRFTWWLPANVRGQSVRLVAVDNATGTGGWIGISSPLEFSYLALLHQQLSDAVLTLSCSLLYFALFLLPGFAAAGLLCLKQCSLRRHSLIVLITVSSLLGYICFWAFFFSKIGGKVFCFAVYLASLAALAFMASRRMPLRPLVSRILEPLAISALAAACYLCFFYLFVNPLATGANYPEGRFFNEVRPTDNEIPFLFAVKIYDRQPVRPFCCIDWLSSDRPPLQASIFLLERPLPLPGNPELNYQLLCVGLQCTWICGVWSLLRALGTPLAQIRRAVAILAFSGFLFYNSVYTWPKLLAATFILFALSILLQAIRVKNPINHCNASLFGVCVGLALMAHPGSLLSLVVFAVVFVRFHFLISLRSAGLALIMVLAFAVPWTAYQKLVDPPGNRLLKMHLAGDSRIDNRSAWQTVRDSYSRTPFPDLLRYKLSNIRLLAGNRPLDAFGLGGITWLHVNRAATEASRAAQREWIGNALGVLNFGWVAAAFFLLRRNRVKPAIRFSGWLIAAALADFLFWAVITFGPDETVTTHSSYADILLLSIGLLGFILKLPGFAFAAILALQLFNFLVVWAWSFPDAPDFRLAWFPPMTLQLPLLLFGILTALTLLGHLVGGVRKSPS